MGVSAEAATREPGRAICRRVTAFGLDFPGPVGLGAGHDRSGERLPELEGEGFGFVELGSATPEPVAGHNPGVEALASAVMRYRARRAPEHPRPLIGINLGRQPQHRLCDVARDFEVGMRCAWACADYLAINLTGPAARPLHAASREGELLAVLERVRAQQECLSASTSRRLPVLVKYPVPPGGCLEHVRCLRFDGLIAVFEDGPEHSPVYAAPPDVARVAQALAPSTALIAGSGIRSATHAVGYLEAGARLVQLHRAYVEQGAALIRRINRELAAPVGGPPASQDRV
jgi:dihydroorotate dehydrogenase